MPVGANIKEEVSEKMRRKDVIRRCAADRDTPFGENNDGSDGGIKYRSASLEGDFGSMLYYYGARFFGPATGRLIPSDSLVPSLTNPQGLDRNVCCRNNPLIFSGSSGHFIVEFLTMVAIGRVVGGLANTGLGAPAGGDLGSRAGFGAWTLAYGFPWNLTLHSIVQRNANDAEIQSNEPTPSLLEQEMGIIDGAMHSIGHYVCNSRYGEDFLRCNEGSIVTRDCYGITEMHYQDCIGDVEIRCNS